MSKFLTPMDLVIAGFRAWQMQAQSAAIIGMRVAGMAGLWAMPPSETIRMVTEKQAAFTEAGRKMTVAFMQGAAPLAIYSAGLAPIGRKTKANRRRLARAVIRG